VNKGGGGKRKTTKTMGGGGHTTPIHESDLKRRNDFCLELLGKQRVKKSRENYRSEKEKRNNEEGVLAREKGDSHCLRKMDDSS